ncbi:septum site-determining protein MinC [soil metagenome]
MALASLGSAAATGPAPAIFDLKSATLSLVAVVLKSADLAALEADLEARSLDTPNLFTGDPVVVDVSLLQGDAKADPVVLPEQVDFTALIEVLERYRISPIAIKGGTPEQMEAALEAGLIEAPAAPPVREGKGRKSKDKGGADAEPQVIVREVEVIKEVEVVREVIREVPTPGSSATTVLIDKPLRSGQQVYARGGDLVVLAVVNFGAEVIADGSIHVYAPLRGKAIAGAKGNTEARIYTTCLEAELLSIAGIYRTGETELPKDVLGKPAQIRLQGEKLVMEPLKT